MGSRSQWNRQIRPLYEGVRCFYFHILSGGTHKQETKHPCVFGLLCLPDDTGQPFSIQRRHTALDVYTRTRAHACDIRALEKGPPSPQTSSLSSTLACAHRVPFKSPFPVILLFRDFPIFCL